MTREKAKLHPKNSNGVIEAVTEGKALIILRHVSQIADYTYIKLVHERTAQSPRGFMRYENEDGRNKSDVGGSSESFLKAPRVTRQVYAETSIIPVTYFIASWANSGSPALHPTTSLFPLCPRILAPALPWTISHDLARSDPRLFSFW